MDISSLSELLLFILGLVIAICPILIFVRLGSILAHAKRQEEILQNIDRNIANAIMRANHKAQSSLEE